MRVHYFDADLGKIVNVELPERIAVDDGRGECMILDGAKRARRFDETLAEWLMHGSPRNAARAPRPAAGSGGGAR